MGSIMALDIIFPTFITPTTHIHFLHHFYLFSGSGHGSLKIEVDVFINNMLPSPFRHLIKALTQGSEDDRSSSGYQRGDGVRVGVVGL